MWPSVQPAAKLRIMIFPSLRGNIFILLKISDLPLSVHLILEASVDSGGVSLQALPVRAGNESSRIFQ